MFRVVVADHRPHIVMGVLVVAATLVDATLGRAEDPRSRHIVFTQQDAVQAFDPNTGKGYQIGTATGAVAGTTFVEFQLVPAGPPIGDALPITFQNRVTVTDIDGDQLFFDNTGSGTFHLGVAGVDFKGSGGPLTGTYVVTGGTGKYEQWKTGTIFTYRAVMTNPPSPPGGLGSVYIEVSSHDHRDWKH